MFVSSFPPEQPSKTTTYCLPTLLAILGNLERAKTGSIHVGYTQMLGCTEGLEHPGAFVYPWGFWSRYPEIGVTEYICLCM